MYEHLTSALFDPHRYEIMNFKQIGEEGYAYIHVGSWDQGGLRINDEEIWSNDSDIIQSVCSEPCQKAQIKVGSRPPLHRKLHHMLHIVNK